MKPHYDWLIVGAGFTGATLAERLATQAGKRVLVIDQRNHIAGNASDGVNEAGVLVHWHGPHIFHTNSQAVVDYLSRFTDWMAYAHRVLGMIDERLVPVPFNLTSLEQLWPAQDAARISGLLIETYGMEAHAPILAMRASPQDEIRAFAESVYAKVFLGYTTKQWGLTPDQLAASVTARVPVRVSHDDRYFLDRFQCMPREGYTALFARMLDHHNIKVALATSYNDVRNSVSFANVLYTGAIDAFFDYEFGPLPYRSLRFEFETFAQTRRQSVAQVNYPMSEDFTRRVEMGHLTQIWNGMTTLATEYPQAHVAGVNEPYYPIPRDENRALHKRYEAFAAKEAANVHFAGRLGDYQYYNMDQAVARALSLAPKLARL